MKHLRTPLVIVLWLALLGGFSFYTEKKLPTAQMQLRWEDAAALAIFLLIAGVLCCNRGRRYFVAALGVAVPAGIVSCIMMEQFTFLYGWGQSLFIMTAALSLGCIFGGEIAKDIHPKRTLFGSSSEVPGAAFQRRSDCRGEGLPKEGLRAKRRRRHN